MTKRKEWKQKRRKQKNLQDQQNTEKIKEV